MCSDQKRIYLWGIPRSISTAFLRCMMSRDSCKGYLEPWVLTYYKSADRMSDRFSKKQAPDREGTTFKERKEMLEAPHEGYKEVFVKEFAYRAKTFMESESLHTVVPDGYTHTFLIRHPRKVISSLYQGTTAGYSDTLGFHFYEASFREIYLMHDHVTQKLNQKSVIVDADDLQRDPEAILRLYCEGVGIDYQDSMLDWRPIDEEQYKEFEEWYDWVKLAVDSKRILPKTPSKLPDLESLPAEIQKAIQDAMPFYNQLYEKRLKLPTQK